MEEAGCGVESFSTEEGSLQEVYLRYIHEKVLIIALTAFAACRTGPPRPIIEPSDMCSRCRMAISQNRYAAELVDRDGNVWKFDDIGCMVRYTRDHSLDRSCRATL